MCGGGEEGRQRHYTGVVPQRISRRGGETFFRPSSFPAFKVKASQTRRGVCLLPSLFTSDVLHFAALWEREEKEERRLTEPGGVHALQPAAEAAAAKILSTKSRAAAGWFGVPAAGSSGNVRNVGNVAPPTVA